MELPGLTEPAEAATALGRTAQLSMHPVLGANPGPDGQEQLDLGPPVPSSPPCPGP